MSLVFLVICFVALFALTNFLQSNLGLFPKIARTYKTSIDVPDDSIFKTSSIYLFDNTAIQDSDSEYRPWLTIKVTEQGIFIAQKKSLILLFPKKCLIPWNKITLVNKKQSALKKQYLHRVRCGEKNIYLLAKEKFEKGVYGS